MKMPKILFVLLCSFFIISIFSSCEVHAGTNKYYAEFNKEGYVVSLKIDGKEVDEICVSSGRSGCTNVDKWWDMKNKKNPCKYADSFINNLATLKNITVCRS